MTEPNPRARGSFKPVLPSFVDPGVPACQQGRVWRRTEQPDGLAAVVRLNPHSGAEPTDTVVFPAASTEGASARFFFDPQGPALRGGRTTGDEWDEARRGADSVALGLDTVASGDQSLALGSGASATHDGSLVWSSGVADAASLFEEEVTFAAAGGFRVLAAGPGVPAYVPGAGDIYLDAPNTVVTGKLTVTGLIDPTGLQCAQQAVAPVGTVPTTGTFWVRNDAPTVPMFTNSVGTSLPLATGTSYSGVFENTATSVTRADTSAPFYSLSNDFVFGSQSLDDAGPPSDARFIFDKSQAFFAAGGATGAQWDTASRGANAIALGLDTQASGAVSMACGSGSTASHANSFVWSDSTARSSSGANQVVLGAAGGLQVLAGGGLSPAFVAGQVYLAAPTIVTSTLGVTSNVQVGTPASLSTTITPDGKLYRALAGPAGAGILLGSSAVTPTDRTGADSDNTISLGVAGIAWSNVVTYLVTTQLTTLNYSGSVPAAITTNTSVGWHASVGSFVNITTSGATPTITVATQTGIPIGVYIVTYLANINSAAGESSNILYTIQVTTSGGTPVASSGPYAVCYNQITFLASYSASHTWTYTNNTANATFNLLGQSTTTVVGTITHNTTASFFQLTRIA